MYQYNIQIREEFVLSQLFCDRKFETSSPCICKPNVSETNELLMFGHVMDGEENKSISKDIDWVHI